MPEYNWKCSNSECGFRTTTEQLISEDLVSPDCPDHGQMIQDYKFGIGQVFGAGSSPARPSGQLRKPKPNLHPRNW